MADTRGGADSVDAATGDGDPRSGGAGSALDHPPARVRRLRALIVGSTAAIGGVIALFVVLGLTGSGSGPGSGSSLPVAGVGRPAADFSLPALGGGAPVHLAGLGKDVHRPVVLNFFASWCTPCQSETPLIARAAVAARAAGSNVQFIGVDVNDQRSSATEFVEKSGIIYPVAVDKNFAVTNGKYGLDGLPQTFYIDASGKVIGHTIGAIRTASALQTWLDRLGAGGGGASAR